LERYLALIKVYVPHVPPGVLFNLDETGLSDWEERKPKPVLMPTTTEDSPFYDPVDRAIRHQRLVCSISASGDACSPLLVTSTPAALVGFDKGVRDGVDLRIPGRTSLSMTRDLFEDYIRTIFIR
jgi:hypothetical protein